jgi:uncharacterized coiled-coil protein SlyX
MSNRLIALNTQLADKDATIAALQAQTGQHAAAMAELDGNLRFEIERASVLEADLATAREKAAGLERAYSGQAAAVSSLELQRLVLGIALGIALLASIFLWRRRTAAA